MGRPAVARGRRGNLRAPAPPRRGGGGGRGPRPAVARRRRGTVRPPAPRLRAGVRPRAPRPTVRRPDADRPASPARVRPPCAFRHRAARWWWAPLGPRRRWGGERVAGRPVAV